MISAEFSMNQFRRLAGLQFFPGDDKHEAQSEIGKALQTAAVSEEHAKAVVDTWLRTNTQAPTPADLYELANSTRGQFLPSLTCPKCLGHGWVTVYMVVTINQDGKLLTNRVSTQDYLMLRKRGDDVTEAAVRCPACSGKVASA